MTCRFEPENPRPIRVGATRRWACRELSLMAQRLRQRAELGSTPAGQPERLTRLAQQLEQLAR
ncbi:MULTISPECIES: hypothetical protein [Thiorhodovibrio]|uniref:hypothetical protein n=1 Tax=Thiorhodovibrio TaxID=61593 RepID=UPI0019138D67|nr:MULTISPECIES: hypothetical protein [Thiorhodovibrio]MBK5968813.1 hypothetical protein [Thiorhodovibrio winogradskyi]WPL12231.1 hypothetical protein Thiosp_01991 [Thiorhodovibrio litoralis]